MHVEIQVALNFIISYLYNKLPRRRVNIFGEELDKALKGKFDGHWYPEKPFRGSAYRCIKTGEPVDKVLIKAARESGMELEDIRQNLPEDLAVWVDPGEVSYRIGEKGMVKILYSENGEILDEADREVTKTFNPDAQCFKPIESVSSSLGSLSISPNPSSPYSGNSPTPSFKSASPVSSFPSTRSSIPVTFTTATFAQTKFGSTKLKTCGKRANRMSPTEFSNYIKQRAMIQQQQQQQQPPFFGMPPQQPQRPRSLSPNPSLQDHFLLSVQNQFQPFSQFSQSMVDTSASFLADSPTNSAATIMDDCWSKNLAPKFGGQQAAKFPSFLDGQQQFGGNGGINLNEKQLLESLNVMPYAGSQYQHLLVAN